MRFSKEIELAVFIIALASIPLAQAQSSRPAFEVASIKRNTSGDRRSRVGADGTRSNIDRFVARNASMRMLALYAYPQLRSDEVVGGPAWIDTDRFDVEAKPERSNGPIPLDKIQLMLQALLVERFQLKTHFEMRELSIYNLVVAKDSPRIKLSEDQTVSPPPTSSPDGALQRGAANVAKDQQGLIVSGSAVPISTLVEMLQGPAETDRRIIDKTGLKGLFDFQLRFIPEVGIGPQVAPQVETAFPSLFTAIQEQLGLKLESAKGPVEVLVIDSVSKPSEN